MSPYESYSKNVILGKETENERDTHIAKLYAMTPLLYIWSIKSVQATKQSSYQVSYINVIQYSVPSFLQEIERLPKLIKIIVLVNADLTCILISQLYLMRTLTQAACCLLTATCRAEHRPLLTTLMDAFFRSRSSIISGWFLKRS